MDWHEEGTNTAQIIQDKKDTGYSRARDGRTTRPARVARRYTDGNDGGRRKSGFCGGSKAAGGRAKLWGPRQGERTQKIRGVWGILAGDGVVSVGEGVVFGDVTDVHWE